MFCTQICVVVLLIYCIEDVYYDEVCCSYCINRHANFYCCINLNGFQHVDMYFCVNVLPAGCAVHFCYICEHIVSVNRTVLMYT
jgi:hypothetical protein